MEYFFLKKEFQPFNFEFEKKKNRDGSDETTENCIGTTCPRYAFRCTYGACVAGNAECNRKIDCVGK